MPWTPYPRPPNPPSKAPTAHVIFRDQPQLCSRYSPSETPYITGTSQAKLVSLSKHKELLDSLDADDPMRKAATKLAATQVACEGCAQ